LGSYYGSGSKGGKMSTFLMGKKKINSGVYDEKNKIYKTVCKCGNGHDGMLIHNSNR
jgi:hypothetical protein